MGQGGFGAHSESKLVSQFMQTKFLCHKTSQNSTVFPISYSRDCSIHNLVLTLVCGGESDIEFAQNVQNICRRYDVISNKWIEMEHRMISPRRAAASTVNQDGDLWIIGGDDGNGPVGTSEILKNIDGEWKWQDGPALPKEVQGSGLSNHCVVK